MWVVARVTEEFDSKWEVVESRHETEEEAEAAMHESEKHAGWVEDFFIVREDF